MEYLLRAGPARPSGVNTAIKGLRRGAKKMRVTRISQRPNDIAEAYKKQKRPYRKIKRLIKEREIQRVTDVTEPLNAPGAFTYSDVGRNLGGIGMLKHQIDQALSNYGVDLVYFRKYNTFFKGEEENHANMVYGEDTTAEFYASGVVRAYVSVENMAWNFSQIGLEAVEQINIFLTIERFEQAFAGKIGQIETRHFEVPVSGDMVNCEAVGEIDTPELQANVYATFDDQLRLRGTQVRMTDKDVNGSFYGLRNYSTSEYQISGKLSGRLRHDSERPITVYGLLEGDLSYHSLKNVEGSDTWKLAPQVGDYFSFQTPTGISEQWEVSQIYDRNLTKSGLNPLLGKYVYQISAVRRVESHEQNTEELDFREPGDDVSEILGDISKPDRPQEYPDSFTYDRGRSRQNKLTNRLAKNIYDYTDGSDMEYGGIQTKPTSK